MAELFKELQEYCQSDFYPFHMPGHKRNVQMLTDLNAYGIDITEIEGFDNLHHATGILKEAQDVAAQLYGADETYFLVNGSTAGILTAISSCVPIDGTILMARNCHKAALNTVFLRKLHVRFLYPQIQEEFRIYGGINPQDVLKELKENPEISAVMITSPSVDGMVCDVKQIAEICHKFSKPLIVDEAHGAHFGFNEHFPLNALSLGADIVIHSVHKTLPSLTQTALIHTKGPLVNRALVKKYLAIYQTSSPSYLFMASIDKCINLLKKDMDKLFTTFYNRLAKFYKKANLLENISVLDGKVIGTASIIDIDLGKIVISTKNSSLTGQDLYDLLLEEYHIQVEMASSEYVLAIATIMDTEEGFERLIYALQDIDKKYTVNDNKDNNIEKQEYLSLEQEIKRNATQKRRYTIYEASLQKTKKVKIEACANQISAEFVYLYPPGIPIIMPGEMITENIRNHILQYRQKGLPIQGLEDMEVKEISIII